MDAIAIDVNALENENTKKDGKKISDKVKASAITGAAGAVAGAAAGVAVASFLSDIPEDETDDLVDAGTPVEEIALSSAVDSHDDAQHVVIDPETVMLDDADSPADVVAELHPHSNEAHPYAPFSSHDVIDAGDIVVSPDDVMLAEGDVSVSPVDAICNLPDADVAGADSIAPDGFLSENDSDFAASVQDDLMA